MRTLSTQQTQQAPNKVLPRRSRVVVISTLVRACRETQVVVVVLAAGRRAASPANQCNGFSPAKFYGSHAVPAGAHHTGQARGATLIFWKISLLSQKQKHRQRMIFGPDQKLFTLWKCSTLVPSTAPQCSLLLGFGSQFSAPWLRCEILEHANDVIDCSSILWVQSLCSTQTLEILVKHCEWRVVVRGRVPGDRGPVPAPALGLGGAPARQNHWLDLPPLPVLTATAAQARQAAAAVLRSKDTRARYFKHNLSRLLI